MSETKLPFVTTYTSIPMEWIEKYVESLNAHIGAVMEAGAKLGVPRYRLVHHDDSKFDEKELPHYARQFFGDKGDPKGFAKAWLHHIHHNPHHWQYWIFPDGYELEGANLEKGAMEMPEDFALEMVADWLGSSKVYTGSWNMDAWLIKNWKKVILHSNTRKFVGEVLEKIKKEKIFEG